MTASIQYPLLVVLILFTASSQAASEVRDSVASSQHSSSISEFSCPSVDTPDLRTVGQALDYFQELQLIWPRYSSERCQSQRTNKDMLETLRGINSAVELIETCEVPPHQTAEISNLILSTLESDQTINSGIGHHMPKVALICLSDLHEGSGNCEIARQVRQIVSQPNILQQFRRSGGRPLGYLNQIGCRDIDHIQGAISQASDWRYYLYLQDLRTYLTQPQNLALIESLKGNELSEAIASACESELLQEGNYAYVELIEQLGICQDL